MTGSAIVVCLISVIAIGGMLLRPWRSADWHWACGGGCAVLLTRSISPAQTVAALWASSDVAAFLIGMMVLAEMANRAGLFRFVAEQAVALAGGSQWRLLALIYGAGIVVTATLSNDATAVVLTPAVAAAAQRAKIDAWPHVVACAFVANAASFLLPIANPANLVIWGIHSPGLGVWLAEFGFAAAASIVITFCGLAISQARLLRCNFACAAAAAKLEPHARMVFCALLASAVALILAMLKQAPLGYTTLAVAALSSVACHAASLRRPQMFWAEIQPLLQEVSWGVIALVAGLFVLVGAAQQQQLFAGVGWGIGALTAQTGHAGLPIFAALITLASAVINNLPVGLILHNVFQWPSVTALSGFHHVQATALIAVDVGPNLAVSSSLATILWQQALKKYGIEVSAWRFFRLGIVLTPLALAAALFLRFA